MTKIAALLVACLAYCGPAQSFDEPIYRNGVLTIPYVSSDAQVGQFQDAIFQLNSQGLWQLTSIKATGPATELSRQLFLAPVSAVTVLTVDGPPVQVFLRASGAFGSGCGSPGRITQRMVGNQFEVLFADAFSAYDIALCTAVVIPFVKTIPLSVYGLNAGTYTYSLNGIAGSFNLTIKNEVAGDCVGSCQVLAK